MKSKTEQELPEVLKDGPVELRHEGGLICGRLQGSETNMLVAGVPVEPGGTSGWGWVSENDSCSLMLMLQGSANHAPPGCATRSFLVSADSGK